MVKKIFIVLTILVILYLVYLFFAFGIPLSRGLSDVDF